MLDMRAAVCCKMWSSRCRLSMKILGALMWNIATKGGTVSARDGTGVSNDLRGTALNARSKHNEQPVQEQLSESQLRQYVWLAYAERACHGNVSSSSIDPHVKWSTRRVSTTVKGRDNVPAGHVITAFYERWSLT